MLLLRPAWRREIFVQSHSVPKRIWFWYLANRGISGLGALLVYLAISRASPAMVDAMSGLRYVAIFAGTYALTQLRPDWLYERFTLGAMAAKLAATALAIAGLLLAALQPAFSSRVEARPDTGGRVGTPIAAPAEDAIPHARDPVVESVPQRARHGGDESGRGSQTPPSRRSAWIAASERVSSSPWRVRSTRLSGRPARFAAGISARNVGPWSGAKRKRVRSRSRFRRKRTARWHRAQVPS